jgi:hypothetical protein
VRCLSLAKSIYHIRFEWPGIDFVIQQLIHDLHFVAEI